MKTSKRTAALILTAVSLATVGNLPVRAGASASASDVAAKETEAAPDTGLMFLGRFPGTVTYDAEEEYYFLELRGARLPFKTSPKTAIDVPLEAYGKDDKEKNTLLIYGIVGPQVAHATLLVNPDEEEEIMDAAKDLSRYIQMINPRKFAGMAYTKVGGNLERPVATGPTIQSLEEDASTMTPLIQLKGPKSGATSTGVTVLEGGKILIEGKTYEGVTKAADMVSVTLVKMLCGSSDCPSASACATGGDCGCGA